QKGLPLAGKRQEMISLHSYLTTMYSMTLFKMSPYPRAISLITFSIKIESERDEIEKKMQIRPDSKLNSGYCLP
ncbi:MAG: hypothetical protein ABIU20_01690, partial [Blastocatellia bacterium]